MTDPTPAVPPLPTQSEWAIIAQHLATLVKQDESKASAFFSKQFTWVKTNLLHVVLTWPAAVSILIPVIKKVL